MRRKWVAVALAILFLLAGFLILFEQYITYGLFFELEDALHHEAFAMSAVALGVGILLGASIVSKSNKELTSSF